MELKDVILSTLAELEDEKKSLKVEDSSIKVKSFETKKVDFFKKDKIKIENEEENSLESEVLFLNSMKERLLVLFEGFQAPNNSNVEAKIEITLNFLEYTLANIDDRLEKIEKRNS